MILDTTSYWEAITYCLKEYNVVGVISYRIVTNGTYIK